MKEDARSIRIPVVKVSQPIGEFFVGTIFYKDLISIADFDVRRINQGDGIESYLGIQRELSKSRVKEIMQYVEGDDATFPTAVVLAVDHHCARLEPACAETDVHFWMTLSNFAGTSEDDQILFREIAKVIDGQHRIEGLRNYNKKDFYVNVSIFVGSDTPTQAAIFSTVNLAQTKVNRSLVYDLFDIAKAKSPEKLAHNVVVALDRAENSPFHQRIKRLGTATFGRVDSETLTQATVVSPILRYISGNQIQLLKDRQAGIRGKPFEELSDKIHDTLVLRPFLLNDSAASLADLLWNYFDAVSTRWPGAWSGSTERGMLNKTNGYNALMRFFRLAYLNTGNPGDVVPEHKFLEIFQRSSLTDDDFNTNRYVPGTSGSTALFHDLREGTELGTTTA
jgi:DGQHR domain-containing protein